MTEKIHFSPAEQKIMDILRDREWHCVFSVLKMKDDRRRITDIRKKLQSRGFDIKSELCDGRCGTQHASRIFMRRIVKMGQVFKTFTEWNTWACENFDRFSPEEIFSRTPVQTS